MGYLSYNERKAIRKKWNRRFLLLFSFCFFLLLLTNFGSSAFRISTSGMEPNLSKNDVILTSRFYGRNINSLSGKVVILNAGPDLPFLTVLADRIISVLTLNKIYLGSVLYSHDQGAVVRRSVAVEGDSFLIKDNVIFFMKNNDVISELKVYENSYQISKFSQPDLLGKVRIPFFKENEWITVPENKVLCISDFRNKYIDSFEIGFIDIKDIKWVARLRYWPLNEFKFL